jgi:hypothetical protein
MAPNPGNVQMLGPRFMLSPDREIEITFLPICDKFTAVGNALGYGVNVSG